MTTLNISLEDLVIAYRKAKVDAFYESGHHTAISFAEYEVNLLKNLKYLQGRLNSKNIDWIKSPRLVGSFAFLLKSVQKGSRDKTVYFSNPRKQWSNEEKAEVDFRIIGQHSVNFHILSSLWLDKVGYRIETRVTENSYGCRLKRPYQSWESFVNDENRNSKPLKLQLGHFRNYISDYKKWQKNGIREIQKSLSEEPRIVVATFDLRKFYHRIDPQFLLDSSFINEILKTTYSNEERSLTELLVHAIKFWSQQIIDNPIVPETFKVNYHCGIPLGLGASKVIANLVLVGLDIEIERKLNPVFYGRYVDDFFIALKDKDSSIETSEQLWAYFSRKLQGLKTKSSGSKIDDKNFVYESSYGRKSLLEFGRDKEKIFILEGDSGGVVIEKLLKDLDDNSSEWKMLPDAEENLDELSRGIVSSSSDDSDQVPSLRKTDSISIQRLNFAFRLRDFEAMVGLTPENLWQVGLERFFNISLDFIFSAENIPVYYKYYPRIIRLAIKAGKLRTLLDIFDRYENSWSFLKERSQRKEDKRLLNECQQYGDKLMKEAVITALPADDYISPQLRKVLSRVGIKISGLKSTVEKIFFADLHSVPFRRVFLEEPRKTPTAWGLSQYSLNSFYQEIDNSILRLNVRRAFVREIARETLDTSSKGISREFVPKAFFFFTRPYSMLEITYLLPEWCVNYPASKLNSFLSIFDLPELPATASKTESELFKNIYLQSISIPAFNETVNASFALTSFETKDESWHAVVSDKSTEPDYTRYSRLFGLLNEILRRKEPINYVVFPELSIPRIVVLYLASKLKTKGISLIAGIEYEKRSTVGSSVKNQVSNQLLYILSSPAGRRHEQLAIIQEKVEAAIHEKSGLKTYGGKKLVPKNHTKFLIDHGGLFMSGLICNDFLNIEYRESLRGLIDALIIVEWNKDTETYDSLVQSTSNDLHCFVMQVNNRSYGDTRLRAPYREPYKRDQVRIRGGEFDYFVLATLDIESIREFQRKQPSPKDPFKPTPTGYKMSKKRK